MHGSWKSIIQKPTKGKRHIRHSYIVNHMQLTNYLANAVECMWVKVPMQLSLHTYVDSTMLYVGSCKRWHTIPTNWTRFLKNSYTGCMLPSRWNTVRHNATAAHLAQHVKLQRNLAFTLCALSLPQWLMWHRIRCDQLCNVRTYIS